MTVAGIGTVLIVVFVLVPICIGVLIGAAVFKRR